MAVKSILDLSLEVAGFAADEVELPNNSVSSSLRRRSAQMVPKGISEAIKRTTILGKLHGTTFRVITRAKQYAMNNTPCAMPRYRTAKSQPIPYFKGIGNENKQDVGSTLNLSNQAKASQRISQHSFQNLGEAVW